jgi:hypothetical protein
LGHEGLVQNDVYCLAFKTSICFLGPTSGYLENQPPKIIYEGMQVVHHHTTIEVEGCKNHTNKTNTIQGWCSKKLLVEMVPKKTS